MTAWRTRPLSPFYPVVFLDALRVNLRVNGRVATRVIYLAIGINMDGLKEVLGFSISGVTEPRGIGSD